MESMVKKLMEKLRSGSSRKKQERRWFLDNGSIFLKELIADCNGKSIPIRSFSSYQILQATANFDSSYFVSRDLNDEWFKGIIEDKSNADILSYVKRLCENGKLDEVIDPMMAKDITSGQKLQVEACVVLALRCCEKRDEDRPKMIQVAKELKRIETSLRNSS